MRGISFDKIDKWYCGILIKKENGRFEASGLSINYFFFCPFRLFKGDNGQ